MGQQNSYPTVIVVHSTMHLMHHNHCQITIIYSGTSENGHTVLNTRTQYKHLYYEGQQKKKGRFSYTFSKIFFALHVHKVEPPL